MRRPPRSPLDRSAAASDLYKRQGTAHEAGEQSVFDLLRTTAERTGEFFRYRILAAGLPTYRLDWRQTPEDSGVTLTMFAADEHG